MQKGLPENWKFWEGHKRTCCLAVLYRNGQIEEGILEANEGGGGLHAEERLFDLLDGMQITKNHTLDLYIVNAPCNWCAQIILNYHDRHPQILINIKAVSAYFNNAAAVRCLRETDGITLEAFSSADWEIFYDILKSIYGPPTIQLEINDLVITRETRTENDLENSQMENERAQSMEETRATLEEALVKRAKELKDMNDLVRGVANM